METGKILILIGALLTLVSTFFFSFFANGSDYGWGLGFVFNISKIMANPGDYVSGESMTVYIVAIVLIVFLVSGVLQLIGLASRVVAIIGSIIVIGVGVVILIVVFDLVPDMTPYASLLSGDPIVDKIWPLNIPIIDNMSLGTITLLAGGALGLAGGIIGTD